MYKTDKIIVTTSFLTGTDINLNSAISQDYNIKFSGRPTSSNGRNLSLLAQDAQSGGTNLNGGTLTISGGTSTGTGSSSIIFKTAKAGSSGTGDNAPTTKLTITGSGAFPVFLSIAGNPTTSDIPTGTASVSKNTATGNINVWINDAGTIKSLTPQSSSSSSDYWLSAKITYNAAGDGASDDAAELTTAFTTSNTIVYLPVGTYLINSTVTMSNITNLKIIGSKNSKILGNTIKTLLSLTNCTNVEITDINFSSAVSDTGTTADTTNGLIKVNGTVNLTITNCSFDGINAITDAIRLIVDDTHQITGLRIRNCTFNGIGQRAIELTTSSFTNQNFINAVINENTFNNIGTKIATGGQAISLKAFGNDLEIIGNRVNDANGSAIEIDGVSSVNIEYNRMRTTTRPYQPLVIKNAVSGKTMNGFIISNNVINVRDSGGTGLSTDINVENIIDFTVSDNYFKAGQLTIKGSTGSITGNNLLSEKNRVIWVKATSTNNYFGDNILDNTANVAPLEPVVTDGAGVTNQKFFNNPFRTATGNAGFVWGTGDTNTNVFVNLV